MTPSHLRLFFRNIKNYKGTLINTVKHIFTAGKLCKKGIFSSICIQRKPVEQKTVMHPLREIKGAYSANYIHQLHVLKAAYHVD
jgi:hypothetical protein